MSNPSLQSFRDRPRAVVILPCREATLTALGADIRDGRHWLALDEQSFDLYVVIQGRIEHGDWITAQCVHGMTNQLLWQDNLRLEVLHTSGSGQARFSVPMSAVPSRGWYTLRVLRNGRYCGRAKVEVI